MSAHPRRLRGRLHALAITSAAVGFISAVPFLETSAGEHSAGVLAGVARAIDGDTLQLGEVRIRLHGIDTPESRQTCERGGLAWLCGQEAAKALRSLVDGMAVECVPICWDAVMRLSCSRPHCAARPPPRSKRFRGMRIETLREAECWRLVRAEDGRCAVVEFRCGWVLSLHPKARREGPDTPDGIAQVVGPDGWSDATEAEERFAEMCRRERRYAEKIW